MKPVCASVSKESNNAIASFAVFRILIIYGADKTEYSLDFWVLFYQEKSTNNT